MERRYIKFFKPKNNVTSTQIEIFSSLDSLNRSDSQALSIGDVFSKRRRNVGFLFSKNIFFKKIFLRYLPVADFDARKQYF